MPILHKQNLARSLTKFYYSHRFITIVNHHVNSFGHQSTRTVCLKIFIRGWVGGRESKNVCVHVKRNRRIRWYLYLTNSVRTSNRIFFSFYIQNTFLPICNWYLQGIFNQSLVKFLQWIKQVYIPMSYVWHTRLVLKTKLVLFFLKIKTSLGAFSKIGFFFNEQPKLVWLFAVVRCL